MERSAPGNHSSGSDEDGPKFTPRKGVLSREYHVLVIWPDGHRLKVGRFPRKPDAARWIERKSSEWLVEQRAAGNSQ